MLGNVVTAVYVSGLGIIMLYNKSTTSSATNRQFVFDLLWIFT